jgi:hypothetical protein
LVLILRIEDNRIWRPGSRKIASLAHLPLETKTLLVGEFAKFMAREYAEALVRAIENQRFKRFWKSLTKRYLNFKKAMGWSTKIWEATELLKNSIGAWRVYRPINGFAVGIKQNVYYTTETGKRIRVLDVARWMEYGTGEQAEGGKGKAGWPGMPPRPLFRPMRDSMSKHIDRYWRVFVGENIEAIDSILAAFMVGAVVEVK